MSDLSQPTNLTPHAQFALKAVGPLVEGLIKLLGRVSVTVVILDPRETIKGFGAIEDFVILGQETYGNKDEGSWPRDYCSIARNKARLCWRTGKSTRTVGECAPYLLENGDTKYGGGVVCDSLIVATSGLPPEFDEAVSHTVIGLFWASVRKARDEVMMKDRIDEF